MRRCAVFSALALAAAFQYAADASAAQDASGFPFKLSAVVSSPLALGTGPGGVPRVYFTTGAGELNCVAATGAVCEGFPVPLDQGTSLAGSPAVGDLNGDGDEDVVLLESTGALRIFRSDGSPGLALERSGAPAVLTSPSLVDVDGDGRPEILFGDAGLRLHALNKTGESARGFPVTLSSPATSPVSVGFLGDPARAALFWGSEDGTLQGVWADDRTPLPGFPLKTGYVVSAQPSLGDLSGTGRLGLCVASQDFKLYAADEDGKLLPGFPADTGARLKENPAPVRLGKSGPLGCAAAAADGRLHVFSTASGRSATGFPVQLADRLVGAPLAADLDADGTDEILAASASGKLFAVKANGRAFPGFPAQLSGMPDAGPVAAVWEGAVIIFAAAGESLHAFRVRPKSKPLPLTWPMPGHDPARSGRLSPNPPAYSRLAISPERPAVTDELVFSYDFRNLDGGGEPAPAVRWKRNGKEVPELAGKKTLPSGTAKKGETWQADIGLKDAIVSNRPSVTIRNTPPQRPGISFEPPTPSRAGGVRAVISAPSFDPDGDKITYLYRWFVDGREQPALKGDSIGPGILKRGSDLMVEVTASDGQSKGDAARISARIGNSAPSRPKAHLSTLHPRCGEPLDIVIDSAAEDPDGDKVSWHAAVTADGREVPWTHERTRIETAGLAKGTKLAVRVSAFDGTDEGPTAELKAAVANCPPTAPQAAVFPEKPIAGDILEGRIVKPSLDADQDAISYRFTFFKNGKAVGDRAEGTKKGDRYELAAVASDGEAEVPAPRVSMVIGNTPPAPPAIQWASDAPLAGQPLTVKVVQAASDPDGDKVTLRYRWTKNGTALQGASGPELPKGTAAKGDRIEVTVIPFDGQDEGRPAQLAVRIGNSAPTQPKVQLSPAAPKAGEPIQAKIVQAASDPDGDKISYRWTWLLDGFDLGLPSSTDALPAGKTASGSRVEVRVQAFDGELSGPRASASATVANAPPSKPEIRWIDPRPLPGAPLSAAVTGGAVDPDGGQTALNYRWRRNGQDQAGLTGPSVPFGVTKKGDKWSVIVTATDGRLESPPASLEILIGNTPPAPPAIQWASDAPLAGQPLTVKVVQAASDPDGDKVTLRYRWTKNGTALQGASGPELPKGTAAKGDRIEVTVIPFDGQDEGRPAQLAVRIGNSAPTQPKVQLSPAAPKAGEPIQAKIVQAASDPDGDKISYRWTWLLDGFDLGLPSSTDALPAGKTASGSRVEVRVQAFDGEKSSPLARSAVAVGPRAASAPKVQVAPEAPTVRDELTCRTSGGSAPHDLRISWSINGAPLPASPASDRLLPGVARAGDQVQCAVTATLDGTSDSSQSPAVTVAGLPPEAPEIAVEPSAPRSGNDLFCRIQKPARTYGRPGNASAVRYEYRWTADGQPIQADASDPARLPASMLKRGPVYRCQVTAHDSFGASPAASAEQRYANSLPGAPDIQILPEAPTARDALSCELAKEAVDPDQDALTYRFVWWKNGAEQSLAPTTQRIPARMTKAGELWRCAAEASDAEGTGPRQQSLEVRIAP